MGSDISRHVNVRIIAATNQDLDEMVAENVFRADLHGRLSGNIIHISPLRERGDSEIERLAKTLYGTFKKQHEGIKKYRNISVQRGVWHELSQYSYSWPGNVRELLQVIEATLMEVGGRGIRFDDFVQRIEERKKLSKKQTHEALTTPQSPDDLSDRETAVLDFIRENGSIQRKQVEELLGLKNTSAWELLHAMNDRELIQQVGSGRKARYVFVE